MAERRSRQRTVAIDVDAAPDETRRELAWPWYLVATVGAVAVAGAGWLLVAGAAALGWLTTPHADVTQALGLTTKVFLLAHGGVVDIGGQQVSLIPLTLTLALVVLGMPVAAFAARQAAQRQAEADDTGDLWVDGGPLLLKVGGTFAASYLLTVALFATAIGGGAWRALAGALVVGLITGGWGCCRAICYDPRSSWPRWSRSVPVAVGWSLLICLAGGFALLIVALVRGWGRVMAIHATLDPGIAGTILLVLIHLLYLPNLVGWATSWVLGASITLGDGSVISQAITDAGFIPAIPVLGVVPDPGPGSSLHHWWLLVGVAAGVVAAVVVTRARPRARFDETALVGGLSGVLAGLLVTLVCWLASGGLGWHRLVFIGAKVSDLVIVAPSLLGLSGLLGGLVTGLVRRPWRTEAASEPTSAGSDT